MKYLKFIESYVNNHIYGGEVIYNNSYDNFEYYTLIQYISNGEDVDVHNIHTDGKKILNSKGNKFIITKY